MISNISINSIISQSEEQVSTEIDGEVVLMAIGNGNYYGFDKNLSRPGILLKHQCLFPGLLIC